MDTYFIAYQTEDSFGLDGPFYKEEVTKRIEEKWYGDLPVFNTLPKMQDGYWLERGIVVIKGNIVVPRAITVVTKYEL